MSNPQLNINRLQIRFRGIPPAIAEAAVRTLGPALLRDLSQQHRWQAGQVVHLDSLDVGSVQVDRRSDRQQITAVLSQAITAAIAKTMPPSGGGTQR